MPTIPSKGDVSSKRKRSEAQLSVSLPASDSSALPAATSSKDSGDTVMASAVPEETGEPRWLQLQDRVNQRFEEKNLPQRYDLSQLKGSTAALDNIEGVVDNESFGQDNMSIMGIHPQKTPKTDSISKKGQQSDVSAEAFYKRPFIQNNIYSALIEYIEEVGTRPYEEGKYLYARVLPIVQSSGTGKSRAMYEASRKYFSFFMVLRNPSRQDTGFPPGDNALFNLLCNQSNLTPIMSNLNVNLSDAAQIRTVCVFLAMVDECLEWLERPGATDPPMRLNTPEGWHTELFGTNQGHEKFYKKVAERTRRVEEGLSGTGNHANKVFNGLVERFKIGLVNLSNNLCLFEDASTIIFYIDEGHELSQGITIFSLQSVFAQLLAEGCATPHAVVLSSTTSKLADLAPSAEVHGQLASERFRNTASDQLVLPWCALPVSLDLQPPDLSKLPEPTKRQKGGTRQYQRPTLRSLPSVKQLRELETQLKIGRPLWYSYYESEGCKPYRTLARAVTKLTGAYAGSPSSANGLRAAIICRLALGPSHTRMGRELASELVARRMARALFIPPDRSYIETAYAVEPVLGYAASLSMRTDSAESVKQLLQLTDSCLIQKGPRGELLTKLAFTLAFDAASPKIPSNRVEDKLFEPAFLKDFFAHLGNIKVAKLLAYRAWEPSGEAKTFADISTATCVLAQFAKVEGAAHGLTDYAINLSALVMAFIEAPPQTVDIDILGAFVLDESKSLKPSNIVLVVAQSKNYKSPIKHVVPSLDYYRERGYTVVHILHESGGRDPFQFTVKEKPESTHPSRYEGPSKGSLFACTMVGISPALANPSDCESIAAREIERHGLTGMTAARVDAQMTTLFNDFDYPIAEAALGFDLGCDWGAQEDPVQMDQD